MASVHTQIRLQKVAQRQRKTSYKRLTSDQKKYIKAWERMEQFDKDLSRFWSTAPRLENHSVDWSSMDENQLDYFHYLDKEKSKAMRTMSKLEDAGLDTMLAFSVFAQLNLHGTSFC